MLIREKQVAVRQLADDLLRLDVQIGTAVGLSLSDVFGNFGIAQIIQLTAHRVRGLNLPQPVEHADARVVLTGLLSDDFRKFLALQIRRQRIADLFYSFNLKALVKCCLRKQPETATAALTARSQMPEDT